MTTDTEPRGISQSPQVNPVVGAFQNPANDTDPEEVSVADTEVGNRIQPGERTQSTVRLRKFAQDPTDPVDSKAPYEKSAIAACISGFGSFLAGVVEIIMTSYLRRGVYDPADVIVYLATFVVGFIWIILSIVAIVLGCLGLVHCLNPLPSLHRAPRGKPLTIFAIAIGLIPFGLLIVIFVNG
jgi:hypothetical protein